MSPARFECLPMWQVMSPRSAVNDLDIDDLSGTVHCRSYDCWPLASATGCGPAVAADGRRAYRCRTLFTRDRRGAACLSLVAELHNSDRELVTLRGKDRSPFDLPIARRAPARTALHDRGSQRAPEHPRPGPDVEPTGAGRGRDRRRDRDR